ncbi:MAG TPA: hypothetical protein VK116_09245 [Planctomycetota bacterium]|nr:hypothetical protein [Planctomycetota bacterium]
MDALPGWDLIEKGLDDLGARRETIEAFLVSMAPERLRALGLSVRAPFEDPELRLYRLLDEVHGDGAHSKYNAYRRQLASFLRAAACVNRSMPNESTSS